MENFATLKKDEIMLLLKHNHIKYNSKSKKQELLNLLLDNCKDEKIENVEEDFKKLEIKEEKKNYVVESFKQIYYENGEKKYLEIPFKKVYREV